jgi:hypothetical protein
MWTALLEVIMIACALLMVRLYWNVSERVRLIDPATAQHKVMMGAIVTVLLLVVLNPEVRIFLLFAQAIGVDVVLLLILLQFRVFFSAFVEPRLRRLVRILKARRQWIV